MAECALAIRLLGAEVPNDCKIGIDHRTCSLMKLTWFILGFTQLYSKIRRSNAFRDSRLLRSDFPMLRTRCLRSGLTGIGTTSLNVVSVWNIPVPVASSSGKDHVILPLQIKVLQFDNYPAILDLRCALPWWTPRLPCSSNGTCSQCIKSQQRLAFPFEVVFWRREIVMLRCNIILR
jgi:hypothetical protein